MTDRQTDRQIEHDKDPVIYGWYIPILQILSVAMTAASQNATMLTKEQQCYACFVYLALPNNTESYQKWSSNGYGSSRIIHPSVEPRILDFDSRDICGFRRCFKSVSANQASRQCRKLLGRNR